jgi:hypothetical protein
LTEQPIVSLGEIAKFLKVNERKASDLLKLWEVPLIKGYAPFVAVLPSVLVEYIHKNSEKKR